MKYEYRNIPKILNSVNTEWFRYFVILSELGNFQEAAKQLNITQQALSKAVSGIEKQLGVKLIERKKDFNSLTSNGKIFFEKSKEIINNLYDINKILSELKDNNPGGVITIGASSFWGAYILPDILYRFISDFPEVYPKIYTMSSKEIEKCVSAGDIDIGLLVEKTNSSNTIYFEGKKKPYIIVGKPQPFKHWSELSYIIPNLFGSESTDNDWPESKFKRKIAAESDSIATSIKLCENGVGAAFIPEVAVRDKISEGTLAIISEPPFELYNQLYIVLNNQTYKSFAVNIFIEEIKKVL